MIRNDNGDYHLYDLNAPAPVDVEPVFNPQQDVVFLLFTRLNPNQPQRIVLNNAATLANSNFNAAHPTRYLIHGWNGHDDTSMNNQARPALLQRGNFNVIVVDWGIGAQADYLTARNRVAAAGGVVAQFIDWLNMVRGVPFASVSCIGFSLGAHVAGFAGKRVTRGRLASIIALDPAFPLFNINNPENRVAATDAIYVESVHTDGGRLGFHEPIGLASFYPNGGRGQTGCGNDPVGACSHNRAFEFYVESINSPNAFFATRCAGFNSIVTNSCPSTGPSMAMGGEPVANGANGVYFLETNGQRPFGQGWRA